MASPATPASPVKLSAFLDKLTGLDREHDGFVAVCPAHSDSHASLRITVSDKNKVLVRCRAGCDTPDVMEAVDLTMADLATMEADVKEVTIRGKDAENAELPPAEIAKLRVELDRCATALAADTEQAREARAYAARRFGLTDEQIVEHGLGLSKQDGGRLTVPLRDQRGVARYYQGRALSPSAKVRWRGPANPEVGSWAVLGWFPGGTGWNEVLVCEGPGDALTAAGVGYDAIAIRGAANVSSDKVVDQIAEWCDGRKVVLAFDADDAGDTATATLSKALQQRDVSVALLPIPREHGDLSDWLKALGGDSTEIVRAVNSSRVVVPVQRLSRALDTERYALNDDGAARWVLDHMRAKGHDVAHGEAGFLVYANGVWERDTLGLIRAHVVEAMTRLRELSNELLELAVTDEEKELAQQRFGQSIRYGNSRAITDLLTALASLRSVATPLDRFDTAPHLLGFRNCTVDLRTGDVLEHSPAHRLTKQVPHDYRPDAECPRWLQFLDEIFPGRPDMPGFMRRLLGYGCTGFTSEQAFCVFYGRGANGKSVLLDTLTTILQDNVVTTPFSTFERKSQTAIPADVAAMRGARFVFASEGDSMGAMDEALLKRLSGSDMVTARFMRQDFFTFKPTALICVASNSKPSFRGQDEGLWRRVKLVEFSRFFEPHERDRDLPTKLLAEAEGILAWLVRGAGEWWAAKSLGEPREITDATSEFRETSDALAGFLPGVITHGGPDDFLDGKEVFSLYREWCDDTGLQPKDVWSMKAFYNSLEERQITKRRSKIGVRFQGVRRMTKAEIARLSGEDVDAPTPEPTLEKAAPKPKPKPTAKREPKPTAVEKNPFPEAAPAPPVPLELVEPPTRSSRLFAASLDDVA